MKPIDPRQLLPQERLLRWAYLLFTCTTFYFIQRSKDKTIPRENMLGMATSLIPSELSHKLLAVHVAVAYCLYKRKAPVLSKWSGAFAAVLQVIVISKLTATYQSNVAAKHAIREQMAAQSDIALDKIMRIGEMTWQRWLSVFIPFPQKLALMVSYPGVRMVETVTYAHVGKTKTAELLMDVYKHRDAPANAPILLYIHGGGWVVGDRRIQPFSLLYQVATMGWVVCVIDYRLSPMVAFPTHLIDAKRAVAYLRRNAKQKFNADPNYIVVGGESAGGHLASLVALTSSDKTLQPGFEDVDTSVRGCIDNYGVHDFLDRHGAYFYKDKGEGFLQYIEFLIMQKKVRDSKAAFDQASPIAWLFDDRAMQREEEVPPFLVVHGTHDTMVPYDDSTIFFEQLSRYRKRHSQNKQSAVQDIFLTIPDAHHMFNFLLSPRALAYDDAVCAFLLDLYEKSKHLPIEARFFKHKLREEVQEVPEVQELMMIDNLTVARL